MHQAALLALGLAAGTAVAETVHGVVVFTRHGDRTTKHYGAQKLTPLGATQNFQVGTEFRTRYLKNSSDHQILGISSDEYKGTQIFASAPTSGILSNTATAFLQGLYPPLSDINSDLATSELNNGSESSSPLEGYQYVLLDSVGAESPDTIWIKGDEGCPSYTDSARTFKESPEFQTRTASTKDFYAGFYKYFSDVYDMKAENMTYKYAYDIFDLLNVARIHNKSASALEISDKDMFQLRTLADSAEFGDNYNSSQPARSIGAETLSGGILAQLNQTVATKGKVKFSLFAGSYDTFLAFFGITNLTSISPDFEGLPDYASTMTFELVSDDTKEFPAEEDLRVRWLLRNGTDGNFTAFPLFGQKEETLPYKDFVTEMDKRAITKVETWCSRCSSTEDFCAAYNAEANSSDSKKKGGISNAVAGVIGAVVTLAVVGIVGGAMFFVMRRRKNNSSSSAAAATGAGAGAGAGHNEKHSLESGTPSSN